MSVTKYNGDLQQAMKWLQNNAPRIQQMVQSKADWYEQFHTQFWANWESNVFDLRTANAFGLSIWCIILNVPADLFGLFPENLSWGYGPNRQNYTSVGDPNAPTTDPNTPGGNFYGGGNTTLLNLNEVRWALQLRYASLISDGRLSYINQMLNFIFNGGQPWDFPGKKYFYVADGTVTAQPANVTAIYVAGVLQSVAAYSVNVNTGVVTFTTAPANGAAVTWTGSFNQAIAGTPVNIGTGNGSNKTFTLTAPGIVNPVTTTNYMEYRVGANMGLSAQFITLLNSSQYGICPSCAGIKYLVVQES